MKNYKTKYGHFSNDGKEYIITTPKTPRPWINVISNGDYGLVISQTGGGYSWRTHAGLNRITRWEQDIIKDEWGKYLYIRDNDSEKYWSAAWKPVGYEPDEYECHHGMGYTKIISSYEKIKSELLVFVPNDDPLEIWKITLTNNSKKPRNLDLFSYFEWCLGAAPDWHREFHRSFIETEFQQDKNSILARKRLWEIPSENGHWNANWNYTAFHSANIKVKSFETDKESFLGMYGNSSQPKAVKEGKLKKNAGKWYDPIGSLCVNIKLDPGESKTVIFTLGAVVEEKESIELISKYNTIKKVDEALDLVKSKWDAILTKTHIDTPDHALNIMMNTWLKYQAISGRLWGRTAYYQTGGAFGFRDQLQDCMIYLPINPFETRKQIRLHARHQFKDGTVHHWWHPITELGHETIMTDDLLWMPYVLNEYILETGDYSILEDREAFYDDKTAVSLYDHCLRAIHKVFSRFSKRGIPLIGAGDWNDGMSAVGLKMKGESIWLGEFLYSILNSFTEICKVKNDSENENLFLERAKELKEKINELGWDGAWYIYATKDSGEPIGSSKNKEGKIHLNSQTWAVMSNIAEKKRSIQSIESMEKHLEMKAGPLLLSPAYTIPDEKIGYLTRYSPGMRENGGVYTHAATWAIIAESILKRSEAANRILMKLNPINRGANPDEYYGEPYVTPGNIEGPSSPFYGKGSWTWYTGSAQWLFKAGFDFIIGVRASIEGLIIDPVIPKSWKEYKVKRTFREAEYNITIKNPKSQSHTVKKIILDGKVSDDLIKNGMAILPLPEKESVHEVIILL